MRKSFKAVLSMMFVVLLVSATMITTLAVGNISNLKATNVTAKSATITWSAASGADGYELQYTTGSTTKKVTIKGKNTTSYKLTLTPGKSYTVQVRSYDKVIKTYYGSWYKITVKAVPAKVTNFKATQLAGGSSLKLTWTKVSGATGYLVQRYSDAKGKYINCGTTTGTSLTVKSLYAGTTYKIRIAAYYKYSGKNYYGSYTNITATPGFLAPTSLKVTNTTANSVTLSWGAVSGVKKYQIYNYNTKKYSYSTKNSVTLTGLEAGTAYKVRVRGYASVNGKTVYSPFTSYLSFTTVTDKVTGITATNLTPTSVDISFDKQTNAGGYQVFLYDYATKKETRLVAKLTENTYSIEGLTPGSTYRIGVRSYVYNKAYYYSAKNNIYIDTPSVLEAGAGTTDKDIVIEWSPVRKATRYTVERIEPMRYEWSLLEEIVVENVYTSTAKSTETFSYTHENAGKNRGYYYRVTAYNGDTVINVAEGEVTTTGISLNKTAYSVTVNWEAPADAVRYDIHKYSNPLANGLYTFNTDFNVGDVDKVTINLAPGEYMTYRVYAYSENGAGLGDVATFTVKADPLVIDSSDESKTAQLLMLVSAINKTKQYRGDFKATIDITSNIGVTQIDASKSAAMKTAIGMICPAALVNSKFLRDGILEGELLEEFLKDAGMADDFGESGTVTENLTFVGGKETTTKQSIQSYIEPCETSTSLAYLYNANNAAAWKNGFSSVSTTYYPSTGKYKIVVKIKPEKIGSSVGKTETPYHSGFFSMGKVINSIAGGGVDVDLATLGSTTITAYIDAEGRIYNYKMVAPMDIKMAMSEESIGTMIMKCNFDTTTSYKLYY